MASPVNHQGGVQATKVFHVEDSDGNRLRTLYCTDGITTVMKGDEVLQASIPFKIAHRDMIRYELTEDILYGAEQMSPFMGKLSMFNVLSGMFNVLSGKLIASMSLFGEVPFVIAGTKCTVVDNRVRFFFSTQPGVWKEWDLSFWCRGTEYSTDA
jgi:hypothetical protein